MDFLHHLLLKIFNILPNCSHSYQVVLAFLFFYKVIIGCLNAQNFNDPMESIWVAIHGYLNSFFFINIVYYAAEVRDVVVLGHPVSLQQYFLTLFVRAFLNQYSDVLKVKRLSIRNSCFLLVHRWLIWLNLRNIINNIIMASLPTIWLCWPVNPTWHCEALLCRATSSRWPIWQTGFSCSMCWWTYLL